MDVVRLGLLRELSERGSVTAVARATGRTPSAVSQQLRLLQRQVGTVLVERVGRGVRLTPAGEELARRAVDVAVAVAQAEAGWDAYRSQAVGEVTVCMFHSAAELLLPDLVTRTADHPGIRLVATDGDVAQDDFAALTADQDVVVAHRSDDAQPPGRRGLAVVPLLREPLDVGVHPDHPLAARPSVTAADVVGEPWIGVPRGFPIDRVLDALAAGTGEAPDVVHRSAHLPLIENLVAAGHGIALLPRFSAGRAAGRVRLVPLAGLRAGRRTEVLMRPDSAERRAVRVVVDELVALARAVEAGRPGPASAS